jgi:RNA polymerase sigma-70 factor (ECF subfamily)
MIPLSRMPDTSVESSVELLERAKSGDDAALNNLLARYLPRLTRWARGRLPAGMRSMLDTSDLVQDAIINALRNLGTLEVRTEGTIQAYLRRSVNNRIIDLYRRAARRPRRDDLPDDAAAPGPSPLEIAIGAEALETYERALEALSESDREAVVLRVELGFDFEEIAQQLGKPSVDAARMAVTRALARLADQMRPKH